MSSHTKRSIIGNVSSSQTSTISQGTIIPKTGLSTDTLSAKANILGAVITKSRIIGELYNECKLIGSVAIGTVFGDAYDVYPGPYDIVPKVKQQIAETTGNVMKNDLTVHAIPYAEVSNLANGTTVTIGG